MAPAIQIGTIHSCRQATERTADQTTGSVEPTRGLRFARGSVRFFRQLFHYLEELRCLPNK
jgi:hypothetical protein